MPNEEQPTASGKVTTQVTMRLIDSKTGETVSVCHGNASEN